MAVFRDDAMPEERDADGSVPPSRALSCVSVADDGTALHAGRRTRARQGTSLFMTVSVFEVAG
jgi:hypothetical protein